MKQKWLALAVTVFSVAMAVLSFWKAVHAQAENPALPYRDTYVVHTTKVWKITNTTSVWVVDTTGVCLYIAIDFDTHRGIAAVSKKDLPPGSGCE
jgi:hypothetical protein